MRWRGVRVDEQRAEDISKDLSLKEQKLLVEIKRKYGEDVNLWANASLQKSNSIKTIYLILEPKKVWLVSKGNGSKVMNTNYLR